MKKLTEKQIEQMTEALFKGLAYGVQFNIFDLGKVSEGAEAVLRNGGSLEEAEIVMVAAIAKYRMN